MSTLAPALQKADHLNLALEHICYRLQLPDDQFNAARARYEEIGEWLTREGSPVRAHRPRVFHQGSMLLDTTVRPLRRTEYDLDVVCLLNPPAMMSPRQVFDLIWDRMRASPAYRDVVRPKSRCIRVDLPGKFHLDIVPAVPDATTAPTGLFIPDLPAEVGKWKASDPEGFAKWFEAQCLKTKGRVIRCSMAEASVDPIPDRQPYHRKRPLKRAVQLIKRWRDVRFHGTEELSTPSIVVTRLAADYYDGDARATDAVMGILDEMHAAFARGRPVVLNPEVVHAEPVAAADRGLDRELHPGSAHGRDCRAFSSMGCVVRRWRARRHNASGTNCGGHGHAASRCGGCGGACGGGSPPHIPGVAGRGRQRLRAGEDGLEGGDSPGW